MPVTDEISAAQELRKGQNVALGALGTELGALTVFLDSRGRKDESIDADVSVLLLDASGKVRSSSDFVFYNQPIALAGAVHLRDKLQPEPGTPEAVQGWSSDVVTLELDDVPDEIERIVISASLDPSTGTTFGDAETIRMRVQRTADAADLLILRPRPLRRRAVRLTAVCGTTSPIGTMRWIHCPTSGSAYDDGALLALRPGRGESAPS